MSHSSKQSTTTINYKFDDYNDEIHEQIVNDIYSDPQLLFHIPPIELFKTVRFIPNIIKPIILQGNCVLIKYYNQFCIIGYDEIEQKYKPFAIDKIYDLFMENFMEKYCNPWNNYDYNITYLNILDAGYTTIELNDKFKITIIH